MTCKAQQQNDEMFCAACNLRWDMNDTDPPYCPEKEVQQLGRRMEKYTFRVERTIIKTVTFECEADPLLNKMEIAQECAEQCQNWEDNIGFDQRRVVDLRRVKP